MKNGKLKGMKLVLGRKINDLCYDGENKRIIMNFTTVQRNFLRHDLN